MDYLEIDPITSIAIGGAYQKIEGTDPSEWVNWIASSGNASIGYIWDPTNKTWTAPTVSLTEVRGTRDKILLASDWRVSVSDYPYPDRDEWITYRQELRDFPLTYIPTENPEWPIPPSG
jgi:hypothetical protein